MALTNKSVEDVVVYTTSALLVQRNGRAMPAWPFPVRTSTAPAPPRATGTAPDAPIASRVALVMAWHRDRASKLVAASAEEKRPAEAGLS